MKISVNLKQAVITEHETLTTGSQGIILAVEFSPEWDGLAKTAVFYNGIDKPIPILMFSEGVVIPWEMTKVEMEGQRPVVTFVGKDAEGRTVTPTVECDLDTVWYGIRADTYPTEPPTPDWVDQIEAALNNKLDKPATPGTDGEFLAADGTWKIPAGGGGGGVPQSYVDSQDRKILNEAKSYTDEKVPTKLSQLTEDTEHRTVTDAEKEKWNTAGVSQEYVNNQDAETLKSAKAYADSKLVTIEIEDRGNQNFWTRPVTTANEIIDMVNAGKEVRLSFYDSITDTGDQIYPYENTRKSVCYFRRNVIAADAVSRISWGVQYNGSIVATEIPYAPPLMTTYATCNAEAAPSKTAPVTWYMPKPSGADGMMIDVFWKFGRADGIGYDISLVWGAPGGSDNVVIVPTAPTSDSLTGQYSIPAEGTVRYQLIEQSGRKRWQYVSGKLISKQFSTATDAATADKAIHGMEISYLPGMEIFLQMDHGNTADVMRLVPDAGEALPVYGNGIGAKTGPIPAGYILHLKNAGDHWQILNYYAAENYEEGSEPTAELKANVFHKFTAPAETITVTVAQAEGYAEYSFQFTTAGSGGNLSIPSDFAWNGGKAPTLEINKTYQVVLFSGTAYISGGVAV